ncbi:N-acetylmuramoyl-L-alanine amidase [Defluviitalea phaphyphila]|uniref:N-acetylmuramoyl-L-alanine amidase n=1 Tax=Defluviitalea phaphyphila TaxID=1473580 RepID=UPI0007DBF2D5|nr:N-acetylmuramoyl-L-alanine amidase [Defluviitalea phaphyphila]
MNIKKDLLSINKYSRPGEKLKSVKGIVVHWVANPNTYAKANRDFFENRKYGEMGYGSAHYIIDLNGDIIQCIPLSEIAYHVGADSYKEEAIKKLGNYPNNTTIGIECTHIDWDGKMTEETYNSLVELCKDLCLTYKLNPLTDLYRHYDITGKDCHKWFVDNLDEWEKFKNKVRDKMINNNKEIQKNIIYKNIVNFDFEGEKFGVPGFLKEGISYVQVRGLLDRLGYIVEWDNESKTVIIKKE